ncbi:MAG: putative very short patch repair endonuclease [Clostridiaceae bacterium]|jgi:DNA mismatch endonuclease (patch repair protein)|nr:putative very short patch repair endonuclease [Clostridiaceae bacterium]
MFYNILLKFIIPEKLIIKNDIIIYKYLNGVLTMDNLTKSQRHKNMKNINSKDTKIELKLRKALWSRGYRYRKHYNEIPGKPDIVLTKYKIAIFCDGEFFHGKGWNFQKEKLKHSNNSAYWINKISKNIERDNKIDKDLYALGWTVIRFWGKDILEHTDECIKYIEEVIFDLEIETHDYDESFSFTDDD